MSIITRLYNYQDCRSKKVFHESKKGRLNRWCMRNFGYLLLVITILTLLAFIGVSFLIVGSSSLESGNYYNHLNDCASIIGGTIR